MFCLSSYDFVNLFCFGIGSGHQRAYGYKGRWWTRMCLGGPMSSCLFVFVCLFVLPEHARQVSFICLFLE